MDSYCITAQPPREVAASSIRQALQRMLNDVEKNKQKSTQQQEARSYSNWRARSIIKEIASLKSTEALMEFEKELRDVLLFQEIRRRTKMINAYLYGECDLMEHFQLEKREEESRESMTWEWRRVILYPMHICQFLWDEETMRHHIVLEYDDAMRIYQDLRDLSVVRVQAEVNRQHLRAIEKISLEELKMRRLIEVGQEIQYEILRQNLMRTFAKMHKYALDFIKDYKSLFRTEERDRLSLEKFSFLTFDVLMNEAETDLVRVLRQDIDTIANKKEEADKDELAVLAVRDQRHMLEHESQIRMMVVENEQAEWQTMHNQFTIGWRGVYHRIADTHHNNIVTLVSALELFERRYIYDQYRHGMYGIESIYEHEHRIAKLRNKKYFRFFDDYLNGAMALWKQENEQFNVLRDQYGRFIVDANAIQQSKVTCLEEDMRRRQVMGEEVRQRLYLKRLGMRERSEAYAMQTFQQTIMHEDSEWDHLMHHFRQQCILIPMENIRREEYLARVEVEAMENNRFIDLHLYYQQLRHDESVYTMSLTLCNKESACREHLIMNELAVRRDLTWEYFYSAERHTRRAVRRTEQQFRIKLSLHALAINEECSRHSLLQKHQQAGIVAKLELVQRSEATYRRALVKNEKQRREFIAASVPYEHLFLRACEVSELENRLDIIHEAEMTIRATAIRYGHDAPVEYCEDDLRLLYAQLHFQTVEEVIQNNQRYLLTEVEPPERYQVEEAWSSNFFLFQTLFEEGRCRLQLYQKEKADWWSFSVLSSRILGRQKSFEARMLPLVEPTKLSTREELLQYLQQQSHEASEGSIRKKRETIRSALSTLMEALYWSRDKILREEAVERYGLKLRLAKETEEWRQLLEEAALHHKEMEDEEMTEEEMEEEEFLARHRLQVSLPGPSPAPPTLAIHSVVMPYDGLDQRAAFMLTRHSDEVEWHRTALKKYRVLHVGGKRVEMVIPDIQTPLSWLPAGAPFRGVFFVTLLDKEDNVVGTGSHLLQPEEERASCISFDLDHSQGQLHLARYVFYTPA